MTADHETMTAEQIEALEIWAPFWSEADCRKALGVIEAQAASLARLQAAQAVAREALKKALTATADVCAMWNAGLTLAGENTEAIRRVARSSDLAISRIDAALKGADPAQGGE